jgi:hypothetical protein
MRTDYKVKRSTVVAGSGYNAMRDEKHLTEAPLARGFRVFALGMSTTLPSVRRRFHLGPFGCSRRVPVEAEELR